MVSIATFNLLGHGNGLNMLRDLCTSYNLVCVLEHWLRHYELNVLQSVTKFHSVVVFSAMTESAVTYGRPFGVLFILYNNSTVKNIVNHGCSINNRVMACSFVVGNKHVLLFNVYLP